MAVPPMLAVFLSVLLLTTVAAAAEEIQGIDVEGSAAFITRTGEALALLRGTESFQVVKPYISIIKEGEHSGMWASLPKPTYEVGEVTWKRSAVWFAGSIVHDGYHSKLFHDGKKWTDSQAETDCLKIQAQALREMHADPADVAYVEKLEPHPESYTGAGTKADYKARSW